MAEPVTWDALQAIKARVERIKISEGFLTNLGVGRILTDRSRLKLKDQDSVLLIVAGEITSDEASSSARIVNSDMDVTLEFAITFDSESPELIAHRARADIVKALSQPLSRDERRCLRSLTITGSSFAQDADESAVLFTLAQVTARAGLTELQAPAQ